ncbi:flagellar hook-basal body complex protein [Oscillospiraceae bacterium WX1]
MMRSLFSAVSGLKSNQTAMDIIGNNIANVNTTGYKTSRTIFQDIFSQTISSATAPTATTGGSNPKQVGLGVSISTIGMNMTEGSTQSTSNPLDFAISGEGFFVVDDGSGSYKYTRNGALQLDSQGFLVTANGDYVMAVTQDDDSNGVPDIANTDPVVDTTTGAPLFNKVQLLGDIYDNTTTPPTLLDHYSDYAIDANGVITAVNSAGAKVPIGRIILSTFNNNGGLEKTGSSYYVESSNSGSAKYGFVGNECGTLNSGSLEMSNVDLSTELTNMIITQRGFQANSRVITTTDSMLEELINLKR